jgi:hypothetical protein
MPSTHPPDENYYHEVQPGEWVGSIALNYGYADWEKDVWKHDKNSDLRKARPDPHLLSPGDKLYIPFWEPRYEKCATTKRHTFKLKTPSETLRIKIKDETGAPLANQPYVLNVECGAGGGAFKQKNKKLDGEGMLDELIPSTAVSATLTLTDLDQVMELALGTLSPMDKPDDPLTIKGIQQRLATLGYYDGPVDGEVTTQFESSLAAYQAECKKRADEDGKTPKPDNTDGKVTKDTVDFMKKAFGC